MNDLDRTDLIGLGEPREHVFEGSRTSIFYREWGEPSGRPVLMLHATGFNGRMWRQTVSLLPASLRIIAPDLRGHGRSSSPGALQDWTPLGEDFVEFVTGLSLQNVLGVGHSVGGHCILQVAAGSEAIGGLLLVDPVVLAPEIYAWARGAELGQADDHPVAMRQNVFSSAEQLYQSFAPRRPFSLWNSDVLRDYCADALEVKGNAFCLACEPLFEASVYVTTVRSDIHSLLPGLAIPTHILRARYEDQDPASPVDFELSPTWPGLRSAIAGAEEFYLPQFTHFMPMEDPGLIAHHILRLL